MGNHQMSQESPRQRAVPATFLTPLVSPNAETKPIAARLYRTPHCFSEDSEAVAPPSDFMYSNNAAPPMRHRIG